MKKRITILLLIAGMALTKNIFAGHITGGEISYYYTGAPNMFMVTLKLFRDCQGIPLPNVQTICISSSSCGVNFMRTVNMFYTQQLLQPACLMPGTSSCQGGTALGMEEIIYQDTVTLSMLCNDWVMSYSSCCMGNVNTISGMPSIYLEARLNNLAAPTGSSPQFQFLALPWFCLNTYSTYNFASTDVDGDLLSYSFETVMDASGSCPLVPSAAIYMIPYSPANPLSSSIPITLNTSGLMEFTPNVLQTAVIKVRVNALGNGGITGSIMRQNVVYIINGTTGISALPNENFTLSVFPNVSERFFNFSLSQQSNEKITIDIINSLGEAVYSKSIYAGNTETNSIDLGGFPAGVYMAAFTAGNEKRIEKIIKL
ncbi:MAG TPA: T9SS type A sorting domain-containing protein [Bacteroidia bacterium]|nr:T9SS type A sorting domain-containing protein [Bacteroidia bacterium]